MRGVAGPRDGVRGIDGATGARTVDAVRSRLARARLDEGKGRLVAALSASRSALALAESSSLRLESEEAQSRVLFLEQAVPRVVLAGALPAGARVSIDGRPLPLLEATSGTLVDPGEHDVTVAAPGRATWRGRFRVERGDRKEIGVQVGPELGVSLGSRPEGLDVAVRPDAPRVDGWSGLLASYRLGLRPQRSLQRPPTQPTGPIVYGGCTLVPCAVSGPSGDERVDKRLFSSMLRESGLNLVATNGVLLVTASSELLATNTRVGASMMPDGTRYFAFTGSW